MFDQVRQAVYSVFATPAWAATQVIALPSNFQGQTPAGKHVKISILPARASALSHARGKQLSGLLVIAVFTSTSSGDTELFAIGDILDTFLQKKRINGVDFGLSTCVPVGVDPDNKLLYRGNYSISFTSFGE
jgi:hypothetical protein